MTDKYGPGRTGQLDVEINMTKDQLQQFRNAEYDGCLQEHEGATFHSLFDHDHYGLIGFSVSTCPKDHDMVISYTRWEKEPHHELDEYVIVQRDGWR